MQLRIGTRDSALALVQARLAADALARALPEAEIRLVPMKTTGDRILDRTLEKAGGKGLFVRELDMALRADLVDVTVHSLKDVPADLPADLPLAAFLPREDPRDALVLPEGREAPDPALPIGTASPRRALQLKKRFPGCGTAPVRGNVPTRLNKLDGGACSALVLAAAGLRRLGLQDRISRLLEPEDMLPAAGQGIIVLQTRAGFLPDLFSQVNDRETQACALAERAFVRALGGGCSDPTAALAVWDGDQLVLTGMNAAGVRASLRGSAAEPEALGFALAARLKEARP